MANELEEHVQPLKDQIEKLKEENRILLDAITLVPDYAAGIMLSLKANEIIEAVKKAEKLQQHAFNAMLRAKGASDIFSD